MNVYRSKPLPHPLDKKTNKHVSLSKKEKKKHSRSRREQNTTTTRVSTQFVRPVKGLVVFFLFWSGLGGTFVLYHQLLRHPTTDHVC